MENAFLCPDKICNLTQDIPDEIVKLLSDYYIISPRNSKSFKNLMDYFGSRKWLSDAPSKVPMYKIKCNRFYKECFSLLKYCSKFIIDKSREFDWILAGTWLAVYGNTNIYQMTDTSIIPTRIPFKMCTVDVLRPFKKSKEGKLYTSAGTVRTNVDLFMLTNIAELCKLESPKVLPKYKDKKIGKVGYKVCVTINNSSDYLAAGYLASILGFKNVYIEKKDGTTTLIPDQLFEYITTYKNGVKQHSKY